MTDLQTVREALEASLVWRSVALHKAHHRQRVEQALAALSELEAQAGAADTSEDLTLAYMKGFSDGKAQAVPELSREDVERKAREAGFDIFGLPPDILDRFVRFASLVRSVPAKGNQL